MEREALRGAIPVVRAGDTAFCNLESVRQAVRDMAARSRVVELVPVFRANRETGLTKPEIENLLEEGKLTRFVVLGSRPVYVSRAEIVRAWELMVKPTKMSVDEATYFPPAMEGIL